MEFPARIRASKASGLQEVEQLLSSHARSFEVRSDVEVDRARQQARELATRLDYSAFDATSTVIAKECMISDIPANELERLTTQRRSGRKAAAVSHPEGLAPPQRMH